MRYGGNRSILLDAGVEIPEAALRHCVALALTYHLKKKTGRPQIAVIARSQRVRPWPAR